MMKFVVEPGEFKVMVGSNSRDLLEAKFEVAGGSRARLPTGNAGALARNERKERKKV
jgi:hypothetical protein